MQRIANVLNRKHRAAQYVAAVQRSCFTLIASFAQIHWPGVESPVRDSRLLASNRLLILRFSSCVFADMLSAFSRAKREPLTLVASATRQRDM